MCKRMGIRGDHKQEGMEAKTKGQGMEKEWPRYGTPRIRKGENAVKSKGGSEPSLGDVNPQRFQKASGKL